MAVLGWLLLRSWQDVVLHSRAIPWHGLFRGFRLLAVAAVVGYAGNSLVHPHSWVQLGFAAVGMTTLMCIIVVALEPPLLEVAQQILRLVRAKQKA